MHGFAALAAEVRGCRSFALVEAQGEYPLARPIFLRITFGASHPCKAFRVSTTSGAAEQHEHAHRLRVRISADSPLHRLANTTRTICQERTIATKYRHDDPPA